MVPLPSPINQRKATPFNVEGNNFSFWGQWYNHKLDIIHQIQTEMHLDTLMLIHERWEYFGEG